MGPRERLVRVMSDIIPLGVVTVSDRAFQGVYEDQGGPAIEAEYARILTSPWRPERRLVPDEIPAIKAALIELADGVTLDEVKAKTEATFRVALKNA